VIGGVGSDTVNTGAGDDVLLGDNGQVSIAADGNVETVTVDPELGADDKLSAGEGNNIVVGGAGGDEITAGSGADTVLGDSGSLTFVGGVITSAVSGFASGGNDVISLGDGGNTVIGGSGDDEVSTGNDSDNVLGDTGEIVFSGGFLQRITATSAGTGNDALYLGGGDNIALAGGGDDTVVALGGKDIVLGDGGEILFKAAKLASIITDTEGGDDLITVGEGNDIAAGGAGADTILGEGGNDLLIGDFFRVVFANNEGKEIESIRQGFGDSDTIDGGAGIDILIGGGGEDNFPGGLEEDWVVQNDAFILTDIDLRVFELISDSANRSVISAGIIQTSADASSFMRGDYKASDITFTYQSPLKGITDVKRTDRALSLTPLLNGEDLARLSDAELRQFLESLPVLTLGGGGSGGDGDVEAPLEPSADLPASTVDQKNAKAKAQVNPSISALGSKASDDAQSPSVTRVPTVGESTMKGESVPAVASAAMGASLLMAARVSRRKGWRIGELDSPKASISGDFELLRKSQADRNFKLWQRGEQ